MALTVKIQTPYLGPEMELFFEYGNAVNTVYVKARDSKGREWILFHFCDKGFYRPGHIASDTGFPLDEAGRIKEIT